MKNSFYRLYSLLFAHKHFYKCHKLLFNISIRGIGIYNYHNMNNSGERGFIKKVLKDKTSPIVVDIGANQGNYTQEVHRISPKAKIYAIEPHPVTFAGLKKRFEGISTIECHNYGCGSKKAEMDMYDYPDQASSSHASLYKEVFDGKAIEQPQVVQVSIIKADDFINEQGIDYIDLVKIDTEGHEMEVFKGLKKSIEGDKIGAIQFEFDQMNLINHIRFKDYFELLSPHFKLYRTIRGGLLPLPKYQPLSQELYAYQNIVAIKKQ